jgi:hypothetical protein
MRINRGPCRWPVTVAALVVLVAVAACAAPPPPAANTAPKPTAEPSLPVFEGELAASGVRVVPDSHSQSLRPRRVCTARIPHR